MAYFSFVVLILLCFGLFPLCCANFVACFCCIVLISLCFEDFVVLCTIGPLYKCNVQHSQTNHSDQQSVYNNNVRSSTIIA